MTVDGMKCAQCAAILNVAPNVDELTGPAGAMPGKLVVVVALLGLSVLLNLLALSFLNVVIGCALLFGILVGNDGIRRLVMALAWISLVLAGFGLVAAAAAGATVVAAVGVFGVTQNIWLIWALRQDDVRNWMFKTAFKDGL